MLVINGFFFCSELTPLALAFRRSIWMCRELPRRGKRHRALPGERGSGIGAGGGSSVESFRKAAPVSKVGCVRTKVGPWGRSEQWQLCRRTAPCTIYRYLLLLCQRGAVTVHLNVTLCVCSQLLRGFVLVVPIMYIFSVKKKRNFTSWI